MSPAGPFTLGKEERICSRTLIDKLFNGDESRSLSSFPLRVVYMLTERKEQDVPAKLLVSVSKKHFKHAVKRNRVKRQIRETYRLNKHLVVASMEQKKDLQLALAFVWLADKLYSTAIVEQHVRILLKRISDKL